jgi:hypothetical protein
MTAAIAKSIGLFIRVPSIRTGNHGQLPFITVIEVCDVEREE